MKLPLRLLLSRSAWARRLIAPWTLRRRFRRETGQVLQLHPPRSLSEKLFWLMLNGRLERFSRLVDKVEIRGFVERRIGAGPLVPVLGVYARPEEIPWESLPRSFVIKTTHGSGWNIEVNDKAALDVPAACETLRGWLAQNYYFKKLEPQYRTIPRRLLIETRLDDPSGVLRDYRFYCLHGRPEMVAVDVLSADDCFRNLYRPDGTPLPFRLVYPKIPHPVELPANWPQLTEVAEKLAAGFPFVRVDLYSVNGRIYFSELTFTPGAGLVETTSPEFNRHLASRLDIKRCRCDPTPSW